MYAGHTVNDGTNIASDCWLRWQLRHLAPIVQKVDNTVNQAPVVQRQDNAIHRINHYPADSVVCFVNTYPLDSDLSGG